jgi:hypothetical protein
MKDSTPSRTDSPAASPQVFAQKKAAAEALRPGRRVDYRKQALSTHGEVVRRLASDRPEARRTFRVTVG